MNSRFGRWLMAAGCGLVAAARVASGYVLEEARWPLQSTLNMQVKLPPPSTVLLDGSVDYTKSFENAIMLWNEQLRDFKITWTEVGSADGFSKTNGTTEVSMQPKIYGEDFGSGILAVTLLNYSGGQMLETDIVFNLSRNFNSYRGNPNTTLDFHRIALHELGHVLGLDHPDEHGQPGRIAIMNSTVSGIDHLEPDDIQGGQFLYGAAVNAPEPTGNGRVANISTRVQVGTDAHVMIGGFIVQNATNKPVLIRALGPSLAQSGVAGTLVDPVLELHDGNGATIATNNNWKDNPAQAQLIAGTGVAPSSDRESAIYATLSPGAYTAVVSGNGGSTGVGLVEVYDLAPTNGRIANISTRAQVGTDENVLIGGFIIAGPQAVNVIVRGIGPSLSGSIPDALADPILELRNGNGDLIKSNDNWETDDTNYAISDSGIAPKNGNESAIAAYLAPGNFTAIVRGKNNTTGVGLVEVFDMPVPDN